MPSYCRQSGRGLQNAGPPRVIIGAFVKETEAEQPPAAQEPAAQDEAEPMLYCPVCSMRLTPRKCKLICEQCGYYLSCADYY